MHSIGCAATLQAFEILYVLDYAYLFGWEFSLVTLDACCVSSQACPALQQQDEQHEQLQAKSLPRPMLGNMQRDSISEVTSVF